MKVYTKVNKKVFIFILFVCSIVCIGCTSELINLYHKTANYNKVQATVSKIYYKDRNTTEMNTDSESSLSKVYEISYTVDGKTYQQERSCYVLSPKLNDKVTVYFNPDNPAQLRPSLEPYFLIIIFSAVSSVLNILFIFKGGKRQGNDTNLFSNRVDNLQVFAKNAYAKGQIPKQTYDGLSELDEKYTAYKEWRDKHKYL